MARRIPPTTTSQLLDALAHPLRRKILRAMADGRPHSPNQVAATVLAPLPSVAYHIRALARVGCITLLNTARRRGAVEHFYQRAKLPTWALAALRDSATEDADQD